MFWVGWAVKPRVKCGGRPLAPLSHGALESRSDLQQTDTWERARGHGARDGLERTNPARLVRFWWICGATGGTQKQKIVPKFYLRSAEPLKVRQTFVRFFHGEAHMTRAAPSQSASVWNMARGSLRAHLLAVFLTSWVTFFRDAGGQEAFNDLNGFSLNPPYFNLAEGAGISASATCGQDEAGAPRQDLYCKLVGGPNYGLSNQYIQVRKEGNLVALIG